MGLCSSCSGISSIAAGFKHRYMGINIEKYIYRIILLGFCLGYFTTINAQRYTTLKCDFSILEKHIGDTLVTNIVAGKLNYNARKKSSVFNLSFPHEEVWIFQDSTLIVEEADTTYRLTVSQEFNIQALFEEILSSKDNNFGLIENGFTISGITRLDKKTFITWSPPALFDKFLDRIILEKNGNLTTGLIMIDVDGVPINTTYYQDYRYLKELAIPRVIKSEFITTQGNRLYKKTILRNVQVE